MENAQQQEKEKDKGRSRTSLSLSLSLSLSPDQEWMENAMPRSAPSHTELASSLHDFGVADLERSNHLQLQVLETR
jgi:hypothetical protein